MISTKVAKPGLHGIHHFELLASKEKRRSTVRSPEEEKRVAKTINRIREKDVGERPSREEEWPEAACWALWEIAKHDRPFQHTGSVAMPFSAA